MATKAPLIERLVEELEYPLLNVDNIKEFLNANDYSVLFFTEDINRYPESNDVAVVLPELIQAFPQIKPAVIARQDEDQIQSLFDFYEWPALVFMRKDEHIETITRIQDWSFYLEKIKNILTMPSEKTKGMSIPVVTVP
jgi:hydrogenase-1 operon protein HyaE